MNPQFASELDELILFVLGRQVAVALSRKDWDEAIAAADRMEPLAARASAGSGAEGRFRASIVEIARALPSEHPREAAFVTRARLLRAAAGEASPAAGREVDSTHDFRIPIGDMTPAALPRSGALVDQLAAEADVKTVRATIPLVALAIDGTTSGTFVSEVSYLAGWHLLEFLPHLENEESIPVASRGFFVKSDSVAPIMGNISVLRAIADTGDLNLSTAEQARDYLVMYVAIFGVSGNIAGRIAEPDEPLPFPDRIDEATRKAVLTAVEPFNVEPAMNGGYSARGTIAIGGGLQRFEAEIAGNGEVDISLDKIEIADPSGNGVISRRVLLDYMFTPQGWRILKDENDSSDAEATEMEGMDRLPTTLPATDDRRTVQSRPCVVAPAGIGSFAGLPLAPLDDEAATASIRASMPPGALDAFDLASGLTADLPFLPSHRLVLVPHRETRVSVPFAVGPVTAQLVRRTNEWIYQLMQDSQLTPSREVIVAYAKFFFAVIVGVSGRFTIVEHVDEVPWAESASEEDRQRVSDIMVPIQYLGKQANGTFVLSLNVVFKDSLFRTNCEIAQNWLAALSKEDLLLEDQPFLTGKHHDLIITR